MSKDKKRPLNDLSHLGNMVYSTNPDANFEEPTEETAATAAEKQNLKVRIDKKKRRGKMVTLIEGFVGTEADLEGLEKILKTKCGVGGSAKDGIILLQGDCKQKVVEALHGLGYKKAKGI